MRAIDADAFKDYIREASEDLAPLFNDNGKVARLVTENFCKDIDEQPTVFAEPKRGKWVDDGDPLMLTCGNCGYAVMRYNNTPFCPNCGAKMEVTE